MGDDAVRASAETEDALECMRVEGQVMGPPAPSCFISELNMADDGTKEASAATQRGRSAPLLVRRVRPKGQRWQRVLDGSKMRRSTYEGRTHGHT